MEEGMSDDRLDGRMSVWLIVLHGSRLDMCE